MYDQAARHVTKRYMLVIVAVIVTLTLIPIAAAQQVDSDSTIIAVSDSDGSTSDIDKIVSDAEDKGAEIVLVTPDESERTSGYAGSEVSAGVGSPDSNDGDVERDIDGDLIAQEALEGVQLMQPKVEEALSSVASNRDILVVASGNGAGAAGNVLEMIAFDEGPVDKSRILGHILIGDPYRTGSASAESAARGDGRNVQFDNAVSRPRVGFREDVQPVDSLPEPEEGSEAERALAEQLNASGDNDADSGVDRVGESNTSRGDTSALDGIYSQDREVGTMDGREVIPRWQDEYGSAPMENPNQAAVVEREESRSYKEKGGEEHAEEMRKSESSSGSSSGDGADAERDAIENGGSTVVDNYVPDNWSPGNGRDGADVQAARPANPEANNGEGAMGDGEIWTLEQGVRSSSERGVTSSATSANVTTPGTGVLGGRERGFGELEQSTLSICSTEDPRCASNGMPTLLVEVLTGDLQKTPELAQSVLRGIIAIGRLMSNVDKQLIAQMATESTKCGVSIATLSAAGAAGVGAVSTGVLAPAAVPALTGAAVAAGGAAQSCGNSAETGLRLAADIYRLYKNDPDLIHASELISLIDPDSATGQRILGLLPVEFQNAHVIEMLRRVASVGYALDNIRYDVYLEQIADGAGQISDLNPVGIANLLTVSLSLTDSLVKATSDTDQTVFGTFAAGLGGAVGSSSIANTLGSNIGRTLTQAGSAIDPGAIAADGGSSPVSGRSSNSTSGTESSVNAGQPGNDGRSAGQRSQDNQLEVRSDYAERYDYNKMDVGDGMSAIDFASGFATSALT